MAGPTATGSLEQTEPPRFSIVIPCYEPQARFLQECVNSVLRQTIDGWEAIVVDDASPPGCRKASSSERAIPGSAWSDTSRTVARQRRGTRGSASLEGSSSWLWTWMIAWRTISFAGRNKSPHPSSPLSASSASVHRIRGPVPQCRGRPSIRDYLASGYLSAADASLERRERARAAYLAIRALALAQTDDR
jgi:cellulose synthase/poly-beta-1,6-N-acetylglucosamine synthase-like glycosyltransferase